MSTAEWGRGIVGLISLAVLTLAMSGPAWAEEARTTPGLSVAERLAQLEKAISAHKRAKDADGLLSDIKQLVGVHEQATEDAKVRKGVIKALGGLTRSRPTCTTVKVAALEGIGATRDPDGARYVKSFLKRALRARSTTAPMRAAVGAAQQIADDSLVDPLLKIVEDCRDFALAAQAVQALGHFRECKRKRAKILETIVDTVAKDCPGLKGRNKDPVPNDQYRHTGELARNRWQTLSRVLPTAMYELTGNETLKGVDIHWWIEIVRNNKRNLNALFVDDEG